MAARPGRPGAGDGRAAVRPLDRTLPLNAPRRRAALVLAAVAGSLLLTAPAASAAPRDCAVPDERLTELSGLVVDGPRWWAIADSGGSAEAYALDPDGCATTGVRSDPSGSPDDVEDVALGPDGAVWLADIGDNEGSRASVALVELPRAGPARTHRLTYPDGPHDAEALFVGDDGVPVIVTKTTGAAGVYRPAGPLATGEAPAPLLRAGSLILPGSGTAGGPLGSLGSRTITGAGLSAPGTGRVAGVRTYTDAWLFRLPADRPATADVLVDALRGAPVRVPLPGEAQGEALAFTADGALLSGSEARDGRPASIRVVDGAVGSALAPGAPAVPQPAAPPPVEGTTWSPALVGGVAVVVVLLGLAAAMTVHARRR